MGTRTFLLRIPLELQQVLVRLVQVTVVRWTLVQELLVERVGLVFFLLFVLLALEELLYTRQFLRAAEVSERREGRMSVHEKL